jgi:hypothetical protein
MLAHIFVRAGSFVDYVVTDRIITPPEVKSHFVEKFLYVPYSYQVNSQAMEDTIVGSAAKGACRIDPARACDDSRFATYVVVLGVHLDWCHWICQVSR